MMKTTILSLAAMLLCGFLPSQAIADDSTDAGTHQIVLSAVLCIDLDAEAQAKDAIKREYANARESGGGVVDMEAINTSQDDYRQAKKEEAHIRGQLKAMKLPPYACALMTRWYNCINNQCNHISCDANHCDMPNGIAHASDAINEVRLGDPVVTSTTLWSAGL